MSEPEQSRRMRIIAVAAAVIAMVFAMVAVIVVLVRGDGRTTASPKAGSVPFVDREVHVADVVRLRRDMVERVLENGSAIGVRVTDAALAQTLGLEPGDVITALSGRQTIDPHDTYTALLRLGLMNAKTLYVEMQRAGRPMLLRWQLDGDLNELHRPTLGAYGAGTSAGSGYVPPSPPSDPDPLLDAIEKVDDTHYRLPRATAEALLANPTAMAKGARVVPAIRNGQPDGFKLYAIRPSSIYAKLGFMNGDTIRAVNGFELTSPDKALEVYSKIRDASDLTFDLWRRGRSVMLDIEIIK